MGKMLTCGMLGFCLGMKMRSTGKMLCMARLKKKAMKMMGL